MSDTPILGPVNANPTTVYTPRETTELCEATKDLLLFLRVEGIRCDHLEVTEKGVHLAGLIDDYPSKRQSTHAGPARTPSYMDDPDDR